jgi:hypothetical protein
MRPVNSSIITILVHHRDVLDVVEVVALQELRLGEHGLDVFGAAVAERHRPQLLVLFVVLLVEARHELVDGAVELGVVLGGARDDERRTRLVDEDAVDLVDDGEVEGPLHHGVHGQLHVVAQIVEAELVVGAIGHVGAVGATALVVVEARDDAAHAEPKEAVDLAHPFGIAPCQVVVDRDHVGALALEGVEVDRQGGDQGLALAGLHLGDLALVQHQAACELDVEMALSEGPFRGLAHRGEGVDEHVVEALPRRQTPAQPIGTGAQLVVRELFELRLDRVDRRHRALHGLEGAVIRGTDEFLGERAEHLSDSPDERGERSQHTNPGPWVRGWRGGNGRAWLEPD